MAELPKYPNKDSSGQDHLEFYKEVVENRVRSNKARTDFAIWLGGTSLGGAFYRLSEAEKLEVDAGLASIYANGLREGLDAGTSENLTPHGQPVTDGGYLLPPIFAEEPGAIRLQKEGE